MMTKLAQHSQSTWAFPLRILATLRSMRLAVALLIALILLLVLGSFLPQNRPYVDYLLEFGPFWADFLVTLGLDHLYQSAGFLGILFGLTLSILLCLWLRIPLLWHRRLSAQAIIAPEVLRQLPLNKEWNAATEPMQAQSILQQQGYAVRVMPLSGDDQRQMLLGQKGQGQHLGFILVHVGIVVMCLGALLDCNIPLLWQEWQGTKKIETQNRSLSSIPERSRLHPDQGAFRATLSLREGESSATAFILKKQGYYLQELPFIVRLQQFNIERYDASQPKRYVSHVEILDLKTQAVIDQGDIEVNKPLSLQGITLYQSGFGDGGSKITFIQHDLSNQPLTAQTLQTQSQSQQTLAIGDAQYTLELGDFRSSNMAPTDPTPASPSQTKPTALQQLSAMQQLRSNVKLRNLGPSIPFTLRDPNGQPHEYHNYLIPLNDQGYFYALSGWRPHPGQPMQFIRIPLDSDLQPTTFLRLRALLLNRGQHAEIARRTVARAQANGGLAAEKTREYERIVISTLDLFAQGGFPAIDQFLDEKVPPQEQRAVGDVFLKALQAAVIDAMDLAQGQAKLPTIAMTPEHYHFLLDSLTACSDLNGYGAPIWLQPVASSEIKTSALQITHQPGEPIVLLGALLLMLGIVAQLYWRSIRCWVWMTPHSTLLALDHPQTDPRLESEMARLYAHLRSR